MDQRSQHQNNNLEDKLGKTLKDIDVGKTFLAKPRFYKKYHQEGSNEIA